MVIHRCKYADLATSLVPHFGSILEFVGNEKDQVQREGIKDIGERGKISEGGAVHDIIVASLLPHFLITRTDLEHSAGQQPLLGMTRLITGHMN